MKKRIVSLILFCFGLQLTVVGCSQSMAETKHGPQENITNENTADGTASDENTVRDSRELITPDTRIRLLDDGLSVVRYDGDYGFGGFLDQGGAASDQEVVAYISSRLSDNALELFFGGNPFGCSTVSVENMDGGYLFGRNFDWDTCDG